ncbi:hypothetical protein V7124_19440 [Neobacillus niacini]|uniref:hypothetical protein n=1 Tax=Neobacillus niacini TaxID=86668 RepID=UPI00300026A7
MLKIKSTKDLLDALQMLIDKSSTKKNRNQEDRVLNHMDTTFKMAKIDPGYSSGRPKLIFEGESVLSVKQYPYLSSYTPAANDIVLLAKVGNTYVILGKRM